MINLSCRHVCVYIRGEQRMGIDKIIQINIWTASQYYVHYNPVETCKNRSQWWIMHKDANFMVSNAGGKGSEGRRMSYMKVWTLFCMNKHDYKVK